MNEQLLNKRVESHAVHWMHYAIIFDLARQHCNSGDAISLGFWEDFTYLKSNAGICLHVYFVSSSSCFCYLLFFQIFVMNSCFFLLFFSLEKSQNITTKSEGNCYLKSYFLRERKEGINERIIISRKDKGFFIVFDFFNQVLMLRNQR